MLCAGAGFGKTTTLLQAIDKNRHDPYGIDLYLGCRAIDDREAEFAAALRRTTGADPAKPDTVRAVCDAFWKLSPEEVVLHVDDVHHLSQDGEAAALLARLVDTLPENGHLVLASRRAPPFNTARLEANGDAVFLHESDFVFSGEEQTAFLAMRSSGLENGAAAELGGWPALLELAARSGSHRVGDYLWEEIVESLPPRRRRDLARLVHLDWFDRKRVEAFCGESRELEDFLGDLPLSRVDDEGRMVLHALWSQALAEVDDEWSAVDLRCALESLVDELAYREALSLSIARAGAEQTHWLLERLAGSDASEIPTERLETLSSMLPAALAETPCGRLLAGRLRMRSDPRGARPDLQAAANGFRKNGEAELETAALDLLATVAFAMFDADGLRELASRADEVELPRAVAVAALCRATCAVIERRPFEETAAHLEAARATSVPLAGSDATTAAIGALDAGLPHRALEEIDRALPVATTANTGLLIANRYDAMWFGGQVGWDQLRPLDARPVASVNEMRNQATSVGGNLAFMNAVLDRGDAAREHLARALTYREYANRDGPQAAIVGQLAVRLLEGDEEAARVGVEAGVAELSADRLNNRLWKRGYPMAYVVSPKLRSLFDAGECGGVFQLGLDAARALVSFREEGDVALAAALDWKETAVLRTFFVPHLMLELAVAAIAGGNADAEELAHKLAESQRDPLRALATHANRKARAVAKQLLASVPERPSGELLLRVLGPLDLERDGVSVDDPILRRGRVRAMLQYLIEHPGTPRETVGAALWPEFDDEAMRNNLRVNLRHASKLLEPHRKSGEPSFFLSTGGDAITLRIGDGLTTDAQRFEALLDTAELADGTGDPRATLANIDRAIALYRGEYLEDAPEATWAEGERTRLRARFIRAALRAAQLRLGIGEFDAARALVARVREADPFEEHAIRLEALAYMREGNRSAARSVLADGLVRLHEAGIPAGEDALRMARRLGVQIPA